MTHAKKENTCLIKVKYTLTKNALLHDTAENITIVILNQNVSILEKKSLASGNCLIWMHILTFGT